MKEAGDTWTKIESGNVTGYVKNEYCVTGTDALNYAKKHCDTVAAKLASNAIPLTAYRGFEMWASPAARKRKSAECKWLVFIALAILDETDSA